MFQDWIRSRSIVVIEVMLVLQGVIRKMIVRENRIETIQRVILSNGIRLEEGMVVRLEVVAPRILTRVGKIKRINIMMIEWIISILNNKDLNIIKSPNREIMRLK